MYEVIFRHYKCCGRTQIAFKFVMKVKVQGNKNCLKGLCAFFLDPSSFKSSDTNIFDSNVPSNKSSFSRGDERRHEAAVPPLAVSSTRPEKRDSRVSTSSQEQKATNVR